ncbi:MAG: hypothetical protein P8103_10375 [Candidatus Thiodiazotropha sp.]|jgi:hypothetical protein
MDVILWILVYIASILLWLWILRWGGAEWLEGWKAWAAIGWFAGHWKAEQIRLYAWLLLILETVGFVVGLFVPDLRCTIMV